MKSKSLLDLMSPEEREKAIERGKERLMRKKGSAVSPELYTVAEFGYFFGWEGVLAIKRGYIEERNGDGTITKVPFDLEEVLALLEAMNKVWYAKTVNQAHGTFAATSSTMYKNPAEAFNKTIQPLVDRADIG